MQWEGKEDEQDYFLITTALHYWESSGMGPVNRCDYRYLKNEIQKGDRHSTILTGIIKISQVLSNLTN